MASSITTTTTRKASGIVAASIHLPSSKVPSELVKSSTALFSAYSSSGGDNKSVTLPDLPYDYNALEPAISSETMTLHHTKHHNTYVTNLNKGLEQLDTALNTGDVSSLIALQGAIKFNGGGHLNHSLFWQNLAESTGQQPKTETWNAIATSFGSTGSTSSSDNFVEVMKRAVEAKTIAIQGSGWGWLGYNPTNGLLEIATCPNQDPLQATTGLVPLLGIDVWEHAYYVDYRNVRPDYVRNIWSIMNWQVVEERLIAAKSAATTAAGK